MLVVLLAITAWLYLAWGGKAIDSLAVLPLKLLDLQLGSDSGPDYLGTGLADALITRLSAVRRFAVRPTNSVLRYGDDSDPLVAGRELGVAFVLDGRVRRAEDRIRVTGQLLSVRIKRASVLGSVGRRDEARTVLEEILAERSEKWVSAYEIAIVYGLIGKPDNAFRWLATAEREHAVGFTFVRVDPRLESLHSDPRFHLAAGRTR